MERSATSSQTLAVDQQQTISRFSPSELADALVGTVHRLEDDSTLSQLKRWSVVKELAITESQYLRDLLLLRTVFYEPMYCGSDNSMLRVEDAQTIFGNLDQIIDCARSLVEYLTVAVVYESNRCFVARDSSICSASDQNRNRDSQMTNASTVKSRLGSSGRDSPTVIEPALPAALSGIRRECTSRPASQPEANFVRAKSNDSELQLRNSAWADISIAQAFLLTSQRMERVYGQYCRNFEAATQRLVEIKRSAAAAGLDPATPLTMPPTPVTSYRAPSTASPLSEISRGGSRSAGIFQVSSGLDYYESMDMHSGFGNPDTTYNAFIFQFMTDQKQLLEGKTTSWDLPSLLIKPVQRILKYPLLIRSLLGLTPPHTSDHSRLEKAALIVESIAETINALNGCSGLRISTATAVSNGFASGDDGQSRITRELRRVLRRKGAGNAPHTLSKFSAEIATRDKGRLSGRPKSRTKEAAEQHNSNSGAQGSGHSQSSGAEALIEQHELRLSELIRSLRQWEGDLGTMLCQQATLAGRWKELYSLSDRENGGHVSAMSVDPSMPASGLTSSCSDVPFRVGGDPRTPTTTNWQQQQQQKRSNQPEPHSPWTASQPDIRATKSHNVLRNYNRSSSGPDILEPQLPGAALNAPGSIGFSECPSSDDNDERAWLLLKESSVSRYHNALSTIFKTVYPKTICSPLHSKVYPVLNALLQVYSDGPRYILSEISRATNPNSSSLFMSPEHGDERASKLRSILAADLPKLFEYEKTVVRLTLDQIIVIERDFYSQVAAHLSPFEFGKDLPWPKHAPDNSHEHVADESPEEAATNSTERRLRSSRSRINRPVQADSGAPGWGAQIMSSFVARFSERNRVSPSVTLPAGAECISNVQAGLWLLAQETEKNGPSQCIVKSRRRQSFTAPSDTTDSRSEFSITFDEYSETSVFAQPAVTMSIPTNGTSAFGIPASLDSPGVGISSSDVLSWQHGDAPGGQLAVAANARSVSSRHVRKKSSGFIERFAHLRPGRAARVQAALFGGGSSSSSTLPLDLGAEQVKARAHLGLAINVHKNNQMSAKNPRIRSRSTNCAETTNPLQDKSGSWSTKLDRYEPLPLVDSIRFSKGFIDSAFRAVGSENTTPAVIARVRDSSLRTKGAE
ncbi:hypothetical protein LPJ72_002403 [Coemansia sp. Benny D160-2]|nr:hypothetical protein LPJ72_002403 [Coemansia sp. Benny D160-2]